MIPGDTIDSVCDRFEDNSEEGEKTDADLTRGEVTLDWELESNFSSVIGSNSRI